MTESDIRAFKSLKESEIRHGLIRIWFERELTFELETATVRKTHAKARNVACQVLMTNLGDFFHKQYSDPNAKSIY